MTFQSIGNDSLVSSERQTSLKIAAFDPETSKIKWVRQFDKFNSQTMNSFGLSKDDDLLSGLYFGGHYESLSEENNEDVKNGLKRRAAIFHMQSGQKGAFLYALDFGQEESQDQVQAID